MELMERERVRPVASKGNRAAGHTDPPALTLELIKKQEEMEMSNKEFAAWLGMSMTTWKKLKYSWMYYGTRSIKAVLTRYPEMLPLVLELPDEWTIKTPKKGEGEEAEDED